MPIEAIIAGLGNPGSTYKDTRHNAGYLVVDALAAELGGKWKKESRFEAETATVTFGGKTVLLVKPLTFMNASSRAIGAILRFHKLTPAVLTVVYDEYQLPPGHSKISIRGSAGGHNGVADLLQHVGDGFTRLRIGIGSARHPGMTMADYVLAKMPVTDMDRIKERFPEYIAGLRVVLEKGPSDAMTFLNKKIVVNHGQDQSSV
ncbi:MAG: aminoacyl-tRNA hydrolase [Verrucomicrobiota bacterium]|nr:aminoacyl-tRNA hydrolase [Verrucomicrobiota bacterium]